MMTAEEYLNEDTTMTTATTTASISMTDDAPSTGMQMATKKMQKLDLNSLEMFPSLGSTDDTDTATATMNNNKKSAWGAGMNATVVSGVRRPSGMTTQVFQLPMEQQRRLKDSERITMAELCHLIGKETKTTIEASRSGQSQAITFVIRGAETQIMQARRKIWARLAETLSIALMVPEECLGGLIGPGGQRIKTLMEESSTKIMVPKPYAGEVTISGDFEGISLAKQRIESLINERVSKRTVSVAIEVPMLPFVFAVPVTTKVGGAAMLETFAAKYADLKMAIMLPKEDQAMAMVSISGDRHQVDLAHADLESRIVGVKQRVSHVSTRIPKNLHRFLIGPKGATLQAIEEETQCLVVVPPPTDPSDTIIVYGAKEKLLNGLQVILEKTGSIDCQTVTSSPEVKRLLLHRSRTFLRDLESQYNVNIHSTSQATTGSSTSCGMVVEGKKAEVAMATMELTQLIYSLTLTTHFDRLSVPGAYVKFLIGRKGSTLAQIQSDFAVDIIFDDGNNSHGSATATEEEEMLLAATCKENLIKAKEYITKKITDVADLRNVTLKIANTLHSLLIGPKGSNLKKYHDRYPNLFINFRAGDEVTLRGPSAEVVAAQEEMMKEADALKHDLVMRSYTTELAINGDLRRVACDATGELTRHLMGLAKAADVKLSLSPKKDAISIQGLKKDAEAFKVSLLEKLTRLADRASETLSIDPAYHAVLIGKGGKNVKHLAQKYDVRVDFPTKPGTASLEEAAESADPSIVTLTGPKANLKDAKQELLDLVAYEKAHRQQSSFEIPEAMIPFILGKGGVILNEIQLECDDCNVEIGRDSNSEGMRTVSLEGTQEAMALAKEKILAIVTHRQSILSEVICTDALALKKLTGPGGRLYRLLCQKYEPMDVQITCRATTELTLRGKDPHFSQAKEELQALLAETSIFITEQVEVPVESHGDIVGPGGSNIRRLCAEHRVAIQVPRSKDTPMVTVEGSPASVATVKTILKSMVKVADSMDVPQPIHKHIIGPGGSIINTIRNETGCRIILPPPGSSSTTVELVGTADAIAKAKEAIAKIILAHHK